LTFEKNEFYDSYYFSVAERTFYELFSQGTIWCPHLTYPDPVIVLPLMMAAINLTITEV